MKRCDGKTVYTIEGNSGDACRRQAYRVGSPLIYGYGVPNYPAKDTTKTKTNADTANDAKSSAKTAR